MQSDAHKKTFSHFESIDKYYENDVKIMNEFFKVSVIVIVIVTITIIITYYLLIFTVHDR